MGGHFDPPKRSHPLGQRSGSTHPLGLGTYNGYNISILSVDLSQRPNLLTAGKGLQKLKT